MAMEPHAKIIHAVAECILAPKGFFCKGSSRIWLQDHGWFLTVVEFQPSGFAKGTFVNVAMHFLWDHLPGEEPTDISFNYGCGRLIPPEVPSQFVEYYGNDELFAQQVAVMTKAAVRHAEDYMRCTNLGYAQRLICSGKVPNVGWNEYERAMLCLLRGKVRKGLRHLRRFVEANQNSDWYRQSGLWKICEQDIPARCVSSEAARQMVVEKIQANRAQLLTKVAFKGMNKELYQG